MEHIYIIALCFTLLIWSFQRWTKVTYRGNLPPGPAPLPLLGNMLDLSKAYKSPEAELGRLAEKYGDMYTLWLGSTPLIVVNSPRISTDLMEKRGVIYSSRSPNNKFREFITQWRILSMPYGEAFRFIRRVYQQLLGPKQAVLYHTYQDRESKASISTIAVNSEDFLLETTRYAMSVIFSVIYGVRLERLDHPLMIELDHIFSKMLGYMHPGSMLIDYLPFLERLPEWAQPWLQKAKRIRQREIDLHLAFLNTLREQIRRGSPPDCVGSLLLNIQKKEGVSDEHACDMLAILIHGGIETTMLILQNFFKIAALHPEAVRKAQVELDYVVGSSRLPTFDDEQHLPYIRAFIKEIHRWCPAGTLGVAHATTSDDEYAGLFLPEGTLISPNFRLINRSPERYDHPDIFDPERFVGDDRDARASAAQADFTKRDHWHYGFGRRLCPGISVGESNLYIFIARALWAFDIKPFPGDPPLNMDDKIFAHLHKPKPFRLSITYRSSDHENTVNVEKMNLASDIPKFDHVVY